MKFNQVKYSNNIGVEDQDLVVKFGFAKKTAEDTYTNMTDISECRDFMGDAVCCMADKKTREIYGFSYNPEKTPLEQEYTCIVIKFPNKTVLKTFQEQLDRLEEFLIVNNLPSSFVLQPFENKSSTLVVCVDKFWQETTFNISYITYLLKSICWKLPEGDEELLDKIEITKIGQYFTKEAKYLAHGVKTALIQLMPKLVELTKKHKYPHGYNNADIETHTIHNRTGFNFNCRWKDGGTVISKWLKENT